MKVHQAMFTYAFTNKSTARKCQPLHHKDLMLGFRINDDGFSLIVKGTPQCDFLGGVRLFGMLEECSKNSCRNR